MARAATTFTETELPIQAPVEEPIINSPYVEPKWHWAYEKSGKANKLSGRRDARYFWTTQRVTTTQQEIEGIGGDYGSEPLPLVNALREDVARWRASGYENATQITKKLLAHWQRPDRARRFFFCQLEAVETIIYLNEILASGRKPRFTPRVSQEDYSAMLIGRKPPIAADMGDDFFSRLCDQPWDETQPALTRYGCKMATGSGKTVVMAMIVAWTFCNRGAVDGDTRFPKAVLIACPNLTVKERLQVLRTDGPPEAGYYSQFDIVPSQLRSLLATGRVMVTNWHAFAPESEHAEGGASFAVVKKGAEGADAFARRVLKDLYGRGELLVLNDEAHHAYRPAPPEKSVKVAKKKPGDGPAFGAVTDDDNKEATVWVEGLDKLRASVGIRACVDLSATPFYLGGSGYIEGSPFPWLVSDFGLVDAIESGITKIPRLPVADTSGRPDPKFFRLWEEIRRRLEQQGGADIIRGKPRPEAVWREAQPALAMLASQWQERFEYNKSAKPGQTFIPPVVIVVCDNTDLAQVFFECISGEVVEELSDVDDAGTVTTRKVRNFSPAGVPFPDLANTESRTVTLRIDSKLLNEAEAGAGGSKLKEAERLRELISQVGKPGTPGEHIRCVVSVQMLTEGWDANNVTQILGLRAFGSQLLCEQVVGRGLRRINYDAHTDPATGEERLRPEYVDVYGIPFSVIPFKGREGKKPEPGDKPTTLVQALTERAAMEMVFPNVDGYVMELRQHRIRCNVTKVEGLSIQPTEHPTRAYVQPQVGVRDGQRGSASFALTQHTREEFYALHHIQTILFEIARQIVARLTESQPGKEAKLRHHARHQLFPQVLRIVEDYAQSRVQWNGCEQQELALEVYMRKMVERLTDAIQPDTASGEPPLLPVINRFRPHGSTAEVRFTTTRACHPTFKSHIDQVVLDTDTWERSVSFQLETEPVVQFFARNDHLGLEIPYEFFGVAHRFIPDFIVRLQSGVNLILEVKGMMGEREEQKFEATKRWVSAVNNWGRMGRWAFHVCKNPDALKTEIEYLNAQPAA